MLTDPGLLNHGLKYLNLEFYLDLSPSPLAYLQKYSSKCSFKNWKLYVAISCFFLSIRLSDLSPYKISIFIERKLMMHNYR